MKFNTMKKKQSKPRNHIFVDLMTDKYDMRVVPNKKKKLRYQPPEEFDARNWKNSKNWREEFTE